MTESILLRDLSIVVTRKDVKHVHLSVHPPDGRVTLVAPRTTRMQAARAYAATGLRWIREQQQQLRLQARGSWREFVTRESHYLWGKLYLLLVNELQAKPHVTADHRRITLSVRPGSTVAKRRAVLHSWHKELLHATVPSLIEKWEARIGVTAQGYFLQRMKPSGEGAIRALERFA